MMAFLIPIINISPVLEKSRLYNYEAVQWIPVVETSALSISDAAPDASFQWNMLNVALLIFCTGALLMVVRLILQYFSVRSIQHASKLISDGEVKIYHVDKNIIPFSFGNSIFINQHKHTEKELEDIIRHEFIHVKQKHTIDILWSELLCVLNWYNPFAWLMRNAIRQNLEFIADNKVIQNGIDKKQYQYLLLKVIGVPRYSMATNFNFTSLKKRIAMMNKIRSAKVHFIKFLFVLPLVVVMLLAFREKSGTEASNNNVFRDLSIPQAELQTDTVPKKQETDAKPHVFYKPEPNSKGYVITVADNHGECVVIVKDKQKKIVKAVSLVEWDNNKKEYTDLYGEIAPAPSAAPRVIIDKISSSQPSKPNVFIHKTPSPAAAPSATMEAVAMPEDISAVHVKDNLITIVWKNGETENYDLSNPQQKDVFERKYGQGTATRSTNQNRDAERNSANKNPTVALEKGNVSYNNNPDQKDSSEVMIHKQVTVNTGPGERVNIKKLGDFNGIILLDDKEYDKNTFDKEVHLYAYQILSVEILKDQPAIKSYGEKGKNGVIIIKTKEKKD
jgi:hypothetical protein